MQPAMNSVLATDATTGISQAGRVGVGSGLGFVLGAGFATLEIGAGSGGAGFAAEVERPLEAAGGFAWGDGLEVAEGFAAEFALTLSMTSFGHSGPESSGSISNSTGSGAGVAWGTGFLGGWSTLATGMGAGSAAGLGGWMILATGMGAGSAAGFGFGSDFVGGWTAPTTGMASDDRREFGSKGAAITNIWPQLLQRADFPTIDQGRS
jgi:hypothetical protein